MNVRKFVGFSTALVLVGGLVVASGFSRAPSATASELTLSFESALVWSEDEERVLHEAQQRLIADCMSLAGFDYEYPEYSPRYEVPEVGVASPAEIEHLATQGAALDHEPAQDHRSEEWRVALFGSENDQMVVKGEDWEVRKPNTGCVAESQEAIVGDRAAHSRLLSAMEALRSELRLATRNDPRIVALDGDWARCMSEAGFSFGTPLESWSAVAEAASETDRRHGAEADLSCKLATDYLATWHTVWSDHATDIAQENASAVVEWAEAKANHLTRARLLMDEI